MLIRKIEDEAKLQAIQTVRRIEEEIKKKQNSGHRELFPMLSKRSAAEHVVEDDSFR